MDAIELIRAERERQKLVEGWSDQHDDIYEDGQLAKAAVCYAASGLSQVFIVDADKIALEGPLDTLGHEVESAIDEADAWPWDARWDKRNKHDRARQLVIAGALIVAELERLKRKESSQEGVSEYERGYREGLSESAKRAKVIKKQFDDIVQDSTRPRDEFDDR